MNHSDRKMMFGLLRQLGWEKDEIVHEFTKGRTSSSSDLTADEVKRLISALKGHAKERFGKSRGYIIHHLCLMGYTNPYTGKADYKRIDGWVRKQKAVNPRGRDLEWLSAGELNKMVGVVKAMYTRTINQS